MTQGTGQLILPTINIVAGGITDHNNDFDNFDFALARYSSAGVLDGTAQADARLGFDSRVKLGDNRYNLTGSGQTQRRAFHATAAGKPF